MINEERVKALYKVALYEQCDEKINKKAGDYYKDDYIAKEIVKSFFCGTIAYILIILLYSISTLETLLGHVNNFKIMNDLVLVCVLYIGFMALYLFITFLIYRVRYKKEKRQLKVYLKSLKKLYRLYKEEKQKM